MSPNLKISLSGLIKSLVIRTIRITLDTSVCLSRSTLHLSPPFFVPLEGEPHGFYQWSPLANGFQLSSAKEKYQQEIKAGRKRKSGCSFSVSCCQVVSKQTNAFSPQRAQLLSGSSLLHRVHALPLSL